MNHSSLLKQIDDEFLLFVLLATHGCSEVWFMIKN